MNVTAHLFSVTSSRTESKSHDRTTSAVTKEVSSVTSGTRRFVSRTFGSSLSRSKRVTPPPPTTSLRRSNDSTNSSDGTSDSVSSASSTSSSPMNDATNSNSTIEMDIEANLNRMEIDSKEDDPRSIVQQWSLHPHQKLFKQAVLPPQAPEDHGKLTLVLDVDETLVHARLPDDLDFRQQEERMHSSKSEFAGHKFELSLRPGERFTVNKRPGLDEFLEHAASKYEIVAYTAAVEEYAKPLLDQLDPHKKIFRHRLYRNHCHFSNGHYLKDLRRVNRKMERVVLVDNNAYCFLPQLNNGIPISSFYNDHTDSALTVLSKFLHALQLEPDVQPLLKQTFNLERILKKDREMLCSDLD